MTAADMADEVEGPRLVRRVSFVVDSVGAVTVATRPVVAICRCGGSGRQPWCDGTHKVLAARDLRPRVGRTAP